MHPTVKFVIAIALLAWATILSAEQPGGIRLGDEALRPILLPKKGDVVHLLAEFEYSERDVPKGYLVDLNSDGVQDFLVQSSNKLCGSGGCAFALIDGKTLKKLGEFFGAPIVVLDKRINRFSVIQSYTHSSMDSGNFATYIFDGSHYEIVSSVYLEGKSLAALFDELKRYR